MRTIHIFWWDPTASIWFEDLWAVGSGNRNFKFHPIKFPIFKKNFDFSRQKSPMTFLFITSKSVVFQKSQIFTVYTYIFALSLFLDKNHSPTYFLCKISYSIFPDPSTTPLRLPATPHDPQPKIWRGCDPNPQDWCLWWDL